MHPSDFGYALNALRSGKRVTRQGWNGKGQFVVFQKAYPDGIPINKNTAEALGQPEGTIRSFRPYLMFSTVQGDLVPWVAAQSDLLADDWQVVEA